MAYVGTVPTFDEHGEALVTRRYAAPACNDPTGMIAKMTAPSLTWWTRRLRQRTRLFGFQFLNPVEGSALRHG